MKTYIKEDILKIYEESGKIIYQATLDGNYKLNNKEGKKLIKYFKYFETNRPFALSCISDMLSSENVVVRTKAAAYLLALNEDIDVAKSILSEISDNNEYGIFSFNAKMTLEVWEKEGYLQIYPQNKSK